MEASKRRKRGHLSGVWGRRSVSVLGLALGDLGAPCPASAPRRAPGLPTCQSAVLAGRRSRERPPSHGTLGQVGDVSRSFPPGSPGASRATAAAPAPPRQHPRGWAPAPGASARHRPRQARPRGRGRRFPCAPGGLRAASRRRKAFDKKKNTLDHQGQPLPESPARSDTGSSRERAPRARRLPLGARLRRRPPALPEGGAGACGRPGHRGPRRPAPEPPLRSASCRRHEPTRRGAGARGPRGVSPGPSPLLPGCPPFPRPRPAAPPAAPSPRALGAPEKPGPRDLGGPAETQPLATAKAEPRCGTEEAGPGESAGPGDLAKLSSPGVARWKACRRSRRRGCQQGVCLYLSEPGEGPCGRGRRAPVPPELWMQTPEAPPARQACTGASAGRTWGGGPGPL